MLVILLEALGALVLLVLIVWWTMFHGRRRGELPADDAQAPDPAAGTAADPAREPPPR
ncbi:hypothetical protein [Xenophilus sp. Marseille-Q4582]|uniref:hypothetical protein n=1 Tax=Xenophilus sp. Marseille-Q4582 TaxID=2866600 RepID=UPI001CE481C3|nr:hypothetical protein [Xenophilus sp. Marseille-Q4582]